MRGRPHVHPERQCRIPSGRRRLHTACRHESQTRSLRATAIRYRWSCGRRRISPELSAATRFWPTARTQPSSTLDSWPRGARPGAKVARLDPDRSPPDAFEVRGDESLPALSQLALRGRSSRTTTSIARWGRSAPSATGAPCANCTRWQAELEDGSSSRACPIAQ